MSIRKPRKHKPIRASKTIHSSKFQRNTNSKKEIFLVTPRCRYSENPSYLTSWFCMELRTMILISQYTREWQWEASSTSVILNWKFIISSYVLKHRNIFYIYLWGNIGFDLRAFMPCLYEAEIRSRREYGCNCGRVKKCKICQVNSKVRSYKRSKLLIRFTSVATV